MTRTPAQIAADIQILVTELASLPTVYRAHNPDELRDAITRSKGGDKIVLTAGFRYELGELLLPPKDGLVTIQSEAFLPDRRIGPDDVMMLPMLSSGNSARVINGTGAKNWKFDGIEFETNVGGAGEVITLQDAENITFDRCYIVAGQQGQKRAIRGNGKNITLSRSYVANIWANGQDSQAFCAWDGAGPYTIRDNYLEAASENVMFGGADSQSADRVPADILIEGNTFSKRLEWKPVGMLTGKAIKNLLEFKCAKRVVVRYNTFENNWVDAQTGYAILFKSVNQNGTAPWSATEDVLFENNTISNVANGFNIQGYASDQPGGHTSGIVIRSNMVQTPGVAVQITGGPTSVTIDRCTFANGYTFLQLSGTPTANLTVTGVLANHNAYGVKGDGTGIGLPSLTKYATSYTWANNVLLGGANKGIYPPTTYFDLSVVPAGTEVGK